MKTIKKSKSGFTIIELLVVVSIIGLLATIAMVALGDVRNKAKDAKIKTELNGIILALEEYNSSHGGYPNPKTNTNGMYCIGASDCLLAGISINTTFPENITAFTVRQVASLFPHFNTNVSYKDTNGNENKGYIYITCSEQTDICPPNTALIIYPTKNSVKAIRVGNYAEINCDLETCYTIDSNSTGNDCGILDNESCTNFCAVQQSTNYDQDGTGQCQGTWFSNDSDTQYYGYTASNSWSGQGYYGNGAPNNHSYFNGSGNCIQILSISTVDNGIHQIGNYCTSSNTTPQCTGQITTICSSLFSLDCQSKGKVCLWVPNSQAHCDGSATPISCRQYDSMTCTSVSGCFWQIGTASCSYDGHSLCSDATDETNCNMYTGCTWISEEIDSYCSGTISCNPYNCGLGCTYTPPDDHCAGSPMNQPSCTNGTDRFSCGFIEGCSWIEEVTEHCEQKNVSCASFSTENECAQVDGCSWSNS